MAGQSAPHYRLWLDGEPLENPGDWILQIEVDERADEASTFEIAVDMSPIEGDTPDGDWDLLEHGSFAESHAVPDLRLLRRITVEFSLVPEAGDEPTESAIVIDGYVTEVEPVFGESRVPDSKLVMRGIDASCLMHFKTVTREWYGRTDAEIAAAIFEEYGFGIDEGTIEATAPTRARDRDALVQRCTDAEFLRVLARRNGFETYVEHAQGSVRSGAHPGDTVVGHFRSPRPDLPEDEVQPTLALFPRTAPSLIDFRATWDSHQPSRVRGWHIDDQSRRIQAADVTEPGFGRWPENGVSRAALLDERLRAILADGQAVESVDIDSSDVPHDWPEVENLARADLRVADWLVRGQGTVRCERYPAILRSRRPVTVSGAGHLLNGRWYVRGVRHRWGVDPESPEEDPVVVRYEADATLVRNALGGSG